MNRFDDARQRRRTLYAAESRLTCLYERLAPYRPRLELIALLDRIHASDDASDRDEKFDFQTLLDEMGMVDSDFFAKNAYVEFQPMAGQRWLNVQDPHVIEELRRRLAPWLHQAGFDEFDFSDLVARERSVTQHVASLAIDAGINGILYLSRMHPGEQCWAIFEGAEIRPIAIVYPLAPEDRYCKRVQQVYGLRLPQELGSPALVTAQVMETGGVVQGADAMPTGALQE